MLRKYNRLSLNTVSQNIVTVWGVLEDELVQEIHFRCPSSNGVERTATFLYSASDATRWNNNSDHVLQIVIFLLLQINSSFRLASVLTTIKWSILLMLDLLWSKLLKNYGHPKTSFDIAKSHFTLKRRYEFFCLWFSVTFLGNPFTLRSLHHSASCRLKNFW